MISIPSSGAYTQPNDSDVSGNIFKSFNLDLVDNRGRMRVGTRLVLGLSSSTYPSDFTAQPTAFRGFSSSSGNLIFALCAGKIYQSNADYPGSGFTTFAGTLPTDLTAFNSDLEIYGPDLYVTGSTGLYKLSFGTTNFSAFLYNTLGSASQHKLCAFNGTNLLYVTNNDNVIYSWNGSAMTTSGANSLTINNPSKHSIAWIKAGSDKVWIGFNSGINSSGSRGSIFSWDGASIIPSKEYKLSSPGSYGCVIKDDVPWTMDAYGRLLAWNGGTFIEKARLNRRTDQLFSMSSTAPYVHSNGMSLVNGRINILINASHYNATASVENQIPSGIWEYDESIGLYHKHSFGLSTSAGTIQDWGAQRIAAAGALYEFNYPDNASARNGTFVAGASYYTDASSNLYGIFSDDSLDTLQKTGIYVSPKIDAQDDAAHGIGVISDVWQKLFITYRKLLAATDKITAKYRTVEDTPTDITGTWVSSTSTTTTFTTSTDISSYWTSGTGGEVEIIQGQGAGRAPHITSITTNGIVYTVTVDEGMAVTAAATFTAKVSSWTKISPLLAMTGSFSEFPISADSTWIQLKLSMLFTGKNEIHKILLVNKPQQSAV